MALDNNLLCDGASARGGCVLLASLQVLIVVLLFLLFPALDISHDVFDHLVVIRLALSGNGVRSS